MKPVGSPLLRCRRCREPLPVETGNGERDCLSVQAFRRGDCAPAFAPQEPLWTFKTGESGPLAVLTESELRRRFESGELDASVLVRGASQNDFIKADACAEFRDVARPRPAPEPVDPVWEYKALVGSVAQTGRQSELTQWFSSGRLDAETLVRENGRGLFVLAGRHPFFASIARPRPVPPPVPPPLPAALAPIPAPPVVVGMPPPVPTSSTGFRWVPAIIGVGSYFATLLVGAGLDRVAFLGSQVDNMAATFVSAAFIAFVLYCLARGSLGNTRIFKRALVIGGLLWLIFGPPQVSSLVDPKGGSKVLIHVFPLSWYAQLPKNDRKGLEVLSIFVMPVVAGVLGMALASFAARYPRFTRWSLLPAYVLFIGLGIVGVLAVRFTIIPEDGAPPQAAKREGGRPAPDAATPPQPKTTTINLVSTDSSASFRLSGPETVAATGSAIFSNMVCGSYKIVASMGGLDFVSKVEVTAGTNQLVDYRWEDLKIRVESPEKLTIYLDERVLGTTTARVRAPVGRCAVVLRGEGKTKTRVYTPGTDRTQWTEETWKCDWHAEAPLDLPDGKQIAHHRGVLHGFVYGAGDMGESTYDLYVEKEAAPLPLVVQRGEREKDTVVAAPLAVSAPMIARQQDLEDSKIVNTGPVAVARVGGGRRAGQFRTNSLGQIFVPVAGTRVFFSVWDTRVKDYAAYAAANEGSDDSWREPVYDGVPVTPEETCPVVNVSWEDAVAYCAWLTAKEREEKQIGLHEKYRLPTDAEWSVAVGLVEPGGESPKAKDSRIADVYPWGREWPPPAGAGNYADSAAKGRFPSQNIVPGYEDGYATTSPVGRFRANQKGLFDMGGNVWQWCDDYFDSRQASRVLRGGAWVCNSPAGMLSSARLDRPANSRDVCFGFRVVLATEASSE